MSAVQLNWRAIAANLPESRARQDEPQRQNVARQPSELPDYLTSVIT
jgi:hypothetical protein